MWTHARLPVVLRLPARWRRRTPRARDATWTAALRAGKPLASALALVLFVGGITLDDLHVFRLPMIYVGAAAAILCYALAPIWFAARLASRLDEVPEGERVSRIEGALLRRRATLGLAVGAFALWLVAFSSGRTPRW